jgi:hypothetical protein
MTTTTAVWVDLCLARGCRTQPGVSTPGTANQLSVVGGQLSGGNLRFANDYDNGSLG